MEDCIFCKIVKGEIPSNKIYEDEHLLAFHDISPQAPVHVLIVPKAHYEDLYLMAGKDEGRKALNKVMEALPLIVREAGLSEEGFRLINNCGKNAGQTVMHVHFHLIGGVALGPKIL